MPVKLISEHELREALRPRRLNRAQFEAGVRTKLESAQALRAADPFAGKSPFLRSAAAYLPLAILSGCKATPAAVGVTRPVIAYKLLSWLAFPAISLFLLVGATLFSVAKIRHIREGHESELDDKQAIDETIKQWWHQHRWSAVGVFAVSLALALFGATSLLFLMYVMSFGVVVSLLRSLAGLGLGNRDVIGRSCFMGLFFLGQMAWYAGIGGREIHLIDPSLAGVVFVGGALILIVLLFSLRRFDNSRSPVQFPGIAIGMFSCIVIPLLLWQSHPICWSTGPMQIKHFVESFDNAPHQSSSWQEWEIPAHWAVESDLKPDLTLPQKLLDKEIAGNQNAYIVSAALRVGMIPVDRQKELRDYTERRKSLLTPTPAGLKPFSISFVEQYDWVIRSAMARNDLSAADRDLLEQRLLVTLDDALGRRLVALEEILRVTQLLSVIDRPVDQNRFRDRVFDLLREAHATRSGAFQLSGGFEPYRNMDRSSWLPPAGALVATSHAVELMQIYGIPDGIDVNWVRSFVKPMVMRFQSDKWIAAATRERLKRLPGATQPYWLEMLFYERTLVAALVLVGLCFYATFSSPGSEKSESARAD